jgi:hypothetical protein
VRVPTDALTSVEIRRGGRRIGRDRFVYGSAGVTRITLPRLRRGRYTLTVTATDDAGDGSYRTARTRIR